MDTNWEAYYTIGGKYELVSFETNEYAYQAGLKQVLERNKLPLPPTQLNWLLGGFFPNIQALSSFIAFAQRNHPNPNDGYFVVDKNEKPVDAIDGWQKDKFISNVFPTQTSLEQLSDEFPDNSLDIGVFDFTFMFMNPEQLKATGNSLRRVLSEDGLAMAVIDRPLIPAVSQILTSRFHRVPWYAHSVSGILSGLEMKLVGIGEFEEKRRMNSLLVCAKNESKFQEISAEKPVFFEQNSFHSPKARLLNHYNK